MSPVPPSSADRLHFIRRAALAPLCLCLVAGLHLVRVWAAQQTPWKGGGFGMFSTVDDESARFLRCWLVTDEGELPLLLPPATDKVVAELRAAPTQAGLDEFAQRLAGQSWRWRDGRQRREAAEITSKAGVAITAATLKSTLQQDAGQSTFGDFGTERVLEPIPRSEPPSGAIAFTTVRAECLRYRYDATGKTLHSQRMLSSTAKPSAAESRP